MIYETILGLIYPSYRKLSKNYDKVKELMRIPLLNYNESFKLSEVLEGLKGEGIKDCNYFTILTAIAEVVKECEEKNIPLNIDLKDMEIFVSDLPF